MFFLKILFSGFIFFSISFCFSQNTYIPDDNFEQVLIDLGYDSGPLDDFVLTANINTLTLLQVQGKGIQDLTGVEDFISITILNCADNSIAVLDLSNNLNLINIGAERNQISSVNIQNNILLESISISDNLLTSIDISNNIQLDFLNCSNNLLTSLDIENNENLTIISCFFNELTNFNIPINNALENIDISGNYLINLDITQGHSLFNLVCAYNNLTEIDVTNNLNLSNFLFSYNNISSIDLSKNLDLWAFWCDANPLTNLDLSNNINLNRIKYNETLLSSLDLTSNINLVKIEGTNNYLMCSLDVRNVNNTLIATFFDTTNNPNLSCIFVDDTNYSETNWINIDSSSKFVETETECENYIESVFNVDELPDYSGISFTLPIITNGNYFTESGGNGASLNAGDIITSSQTIYIYIESLCANSESSFFIEIITNENIIIPKYFTPNNDGENDSWNISDPNYQISSILIFDRFGKIIASILPNNIGWDGYYNGNKLPSSNYWYEVKLLSGEVLKGPFALIRK